MTFDTYQNQIKRTLCLLCCLLPLTACGDPEDTGESAAPVVERHGTYGGTMDLTMNGGGGEGSCQMEVELELLDGTVTGGACCSVEGLSSHGDVDICFDVAGVHADDDSVSGDFTAYEEGYDPGDANGSWAGSFDASDALVGSGSGAMEHDVGTTSFELAYELSFTLPPL